MRDENSVMTFPIKKRMNIEPFTEKWAALYIPNGQRKNEGRSEGG